MDPGAFVDRILQRPIVAYGRDVLDTYGRAPGGLLANGLAYAALFATFPIAFVVLGIGGLLANDPSVQEELAEALVSLFPPLEPFVQEALAALSQGAAVTSIIGVIGLIWSVSQFYVTLDVAFSRIFSAEAQRDLVSRTARGFAWVAGLVGLVLLLIVVGALAGAAQMLLPGAAEGLETVGRLLGSTPFLIGVGIVFMMTVYRVVPPRAPSLRAIWIPAIVAGIAIVVLSQVFLFVAPRLVGATLVAGSLATAFVALAWLSFTFQALLYGAAWVRVRDERFRTGASGLPSPTAPAEPGSGGE